MIPPAPSHPWNYFNPTRIHFGPGCRVVLPNYIADSRVLVVTSARGRQQIGKDPVLKPLTETGAVLWLDNISSNPRLADLQMVVDQLPRMGIDVILAFGGGSVIDSAKVIAARMTLRQEGLNLATMIANPANYLNSKLLPLYTVPTTAGTGSEVTPFATVWDHVNKKKLSIASPFLYPATAIVDPELTYELPEEVTISTGLDALNQAFESVWNRNRSSFTTCIAARAIASAMHYLPNIAKDLNDPIARIALSESSLLAGLCISQTRTAVCHSIGYPLTAHFGLSHGLASAFTMGSVARLVLENAPEGLDEVALLTGYVSAEALVAALDAVMEALKVRTRVQSVLPSHEDLITLRTEMVTPGRADNFIIDLDDEVLVSILRRAQLK